MTLADIGVPLEPGEREIWAHQARRPLDAAYNVTAAIEVGGRLDPGALARTLDRLVDEQPRLRSHLRQDEHGEWRRHVGEAGAVLRVVAPTHSADGDALRREAARAFRAGEALHRFVLWQDTGDKAIIQLTIHHVVCDGLSLRGIVTRLRELYLVETTHAVETTEPRAVLPYAPLTDPEEAAEFWRERQLLAESQELLPTDGERDSGGHGALLTRRLPAGSADALAKRAGELDVSSFSLTLGGIALMLRSVSGVEDFAVRVPFSIRRPAEDHEVSYRVRNLPLHMHVGEDTTIAGLAEDAQAELHEGAVRLDGDLPLVLGGAGDSVVAVNQLDPAGLPLHFRPEHPVRCAGLDWRPYLVHNGTAKFDLSVYIGRDGDRLTMALEYRTARYDEATVAALADLLAAAWTALSVRDHGHPAMDFHPESTPGRHEARPTSGTLAGAFLRHADEHPDRLCLIEDLPAPAAPRTMTYGELADAARAVATRLRRLGAGPGVLVAVRSIRSCALHVGVYGAVLADAPFLMIDPDLPEERVRHMLDDSKATVLVAADGDDPLDVDIRRLRTPQQIPLGHADAADAAYVMYTSGSTGRPKGVAVSRDGLLNRLLWTQAAYPLDERCHVLAKTPISFDVSVWEIFWPQLAGAVCVLAQHGRHGDAEHLVDVIERYGIDTVHFVPAMLDAFLAVAGRRRCGQLRHVITSGERLALRQAQRLHQQLGVRVHNLYGPTEAAIDVTSWTFEPDDRRTHVPIGRPIHNIRIDVRDRFGRNLPVGARGELVISGVGVALGYVGDGRLDVGRFAPGPDGSRSYRTGDLARWRAGGVLEFLGRADSQVKVNGQRTELAEIDSALASCPGIVAAAVRHDPDAPPTDRLTAFLRLAPGADVDAQSVRQALSRSLPQHMLPTRFMTVRQLPYSTSGKLDRAGLSSVAAEPLPESGGAAPALTTGDQRLLLDRVSALLGAEPGRIDPDTDLFHVGLDSISVLDLVTALRRDGIAITTADVFETRTVAGLTHRLGQQPAPVPAADVEPRRFPLSALQQGLVFHRDVSADYVTYVTTVELLGDLDVEVLRQALADVADRHEVLRTAIDLAAESGPEQVVQPTVVLPLVEHDLRGLPEAERAPAVADWTATVRRRPFPWDQAPLFEFHLHRVGPDRTLLSVVEPVLDGWSVTVLIRDVLDAYECARAARRQLLVPTTARRWLSRQDPPGYAEFVRLEREAEQSPESRAFWRHAIAEADDVRWGLAVAKDDSVRPDQWHRRNHVLAEHEAAALLDVADRLQVPVRTVLLAVHVHLVSLFAGGGPAATSVTVNGRPELEGSSDACGLFLNMLPLIVNSTRAASWAELIAAVRDRESSAWRHRRVPYATIMRDAGVEGLDSVFNFTNFHRYRDAIVDEGRSLRMGELVGLDQTYFDLTVQCSLDPTGRRIRVSVDTRFPTVSDVDAERMLDHFVHLARHVAADPDAAPADAGPTDADAARLRQLSGADVVRDWPELDSLAAVVDGHAQTRPDAVAISDAAGDWTYRQVSDASAACARAILGLAPRPGVVAVLAGRSARLWISVLGIWRAGATYLPIAAGQPAGRVGAMLRRGGVQVVVTDDTVDDGLRAEIAAAGAVSLPLSAVDPAPTDGEPVLRPMADCAYIVFTSGSTGEPKGARIGPDAMANHLWSKADLVGLAPTDVVAQVAPASFDQSLWQCMAPWLVGGKALVVDEELMLTPARLVDTFVEHRVTVFETVPSHLAVLLEAVECRALPWPRPDLSLKCLMVSGEALTADLATRWFERAAWPLINAYGATECADDVTHAVLHEAPVDTLVSIGAPIPNCTLEVVDGTGRALPIGVAGELRITGRPVGLGYLDPEHEEGRFERVSAPGGGMRLVYRTGDLGRWENDGRLIWLARLDNEVKLHGRRAELGEVEHHLRAHERVAEAVAMLVDRPGGKRLRVVAAGSSLADADDPALRAHLAARVPQWMLPDELTIVTRMPLTPHGKVDRSALAALPVAAAVDSRPRSSAVGPPAVLDAVRAEWTAILGISPDADSDFFADGGTSLDSVRLAARVGARLDTELDAATVLGAPRFDAFVRAVATRQPDRPSTAPPPAADVRHVESHSGTALLDHVPGRRLDAAAIGYISAQALTRTGLTRADALSAVDAAGPVLRRVFLTPAGTVGHFLVPLVTSDLFSDPGRTAAVVAKAVRDACDLGARCTALTGMLASSLDYGAALVPGLPRGSVTTGHDVTVSAIVLNVSQSLARTGTAFNQHHVAVIGLGSVGRAAIRLAIEVLGSPRRLTLVDGPGNLARATRVAEELTAGGCTADIDCVASEAGSVADAAYDASLIIGAASVHGVMDIDRVRAGTIVVDDSSPHLFDVARAAARHRVGEIDVTEAGMLAWPAELSELRWQPTDPLLANVLSVLRDHRDGRNVMGCLTAGVLRTDRDAPAPVIGEPTAEHVRRTHRALADQGFTGTPPLLEDAPSVGPRT